MKVLLVVIASLLLGACAGTPSVPVSSDALNSMQGRSLMLVQRESPSFVAMTSGKGMFAVAGVGAAVAAGNKMVEENGISDPAMAISRSLAENLVSEYGLTLRGETELAESDSVDSLRRLATGADYALDVVTNGWSYIYDGFNFDDYFVGYSTELRLIDVNTGQIVSSGLCAYDAQEAGKGPVTLETLTADGAAYVKQELADAADLCVREFSETLFATPTVARAQ